MNCVCPRNSGGRYEQSVQESWHAIKNLQRRESARRSENGKEEGSTDSSANCESFRDKLRNSSIQKISLNAAHVMAKVLSDDPAKAEKQRLDFAAASEVRDWCDRHGQASSRAA